MSDPTYSLADIEHRARNYATARNLLGDRVQQLQDEIEASRRKAMPLIRTALAATKAAEHELSTAIAASPGLFKRPKTHIFHGLRVGMEKAKGTVSIPDVAHTLRLIRRHLEDQFDSLVKVSESPRKAALAALPAADLRRIGVEPIDAGNVVVVRPVDGELDKMLTALLKAEQPQSADAEGDDADTT